MPGPTGEVPALQLAHLQATLDCPLPLYSLCRFYGLSFFSVCHQELVVGAEVGLSASIKW